MTKSAALNEIDRETRRNIRNWIITFAIGLPVVVLWVIGMSSGPSYTEQAKDNYGLTVGKAYPATVGSHLETMPGNLLEPSSTVVHIAVTGDNGQNHGLNVPLEDITFDVRDSGPALATFTFGDSNSVMPPTTLQGLIDADNAFKLKLTLTSAQHTQLLG